MHQHAQLSRAFRLFFLAVGASCSDPLSPRAEPLEFELKESGLTSDLQAAAFGNGAWIVVGNGGSVARSDDGESWTTYDAGFGNNRITGAAFGGGIFSIVGGSNAEGVTQVATSVDGRTWTMRFAAQRTQMRAVEYSAALNVWLMAGNGCVQRSADGGLTWTEVTPAGVDTILFTGIAYAAGRWVVSGTHETVLVSPTGLPGSWTVASLVAAPSAVRRDLDDVVFVRGVFVGPMHPDTLVWVSDDGIRWTSRPTPFPSGAGGLYEMVTDGRSLLSGGALGRLAISRNRGSTWEPVESGFGGHWIAALAHGDGRWLIGGQSGRLALSRKLAADD